jgi:hypothetical protein
VAVALIAACATVGAAVIATLATYATSDSHRGGGSESVKPPPTTSSASRLPVAGLTGFTESGNRNGRAYTFKGTTTFPEAFLGNTVQIRIVEESIAPSKPQTVDQLRDDLWLV